MILSLANRKYSFLDLFFGSFECRRVEIELYSVCRQSSNAILFSLYPASLSRGGSDGHGVRGPCSAFFRLPSVRETAVHSACMHTYGLVSASLAHYVPALLDLVRPRSRPPPAAQTHTHTLPNQILHHTKFSISR